MMKTIELHSYLGAFGPTDKYRPGFRTRDGTLLVLTHSKPYNKQFLLIPSKNIISEHFKCRTAYVYLCVADNQKATRYNNVPGGKISFSHFNSLTMNFVKNLIPTITAEALGLSPEATVTPDDVILALVPVEGYEEAYNSPTSEIIRGSKKAEDFSKAIQKAQLNEFLQLQLKMSDVEIPEDKYSEIIESINFFLECEDSDKPAAEAIIIEQIAACVPSNPVNPEKVVAVLQEKIEADTLNVPTGLPIAETPIEEVAVEEATETPAADSLQITTVQTALVSNVPAGMLPVNASDLKAIYKDVDALEAGARNLGAKVREVIFNALDAVSAQVESVEAEDAQINL